MLINIQSCCSDKIYTYVIYIFCTKIILVILKEIKSPNIYNGRICDRGRAQINWYIQINGMFGKYPLGGGITPKINTL